MQQVIKLCDSHGLPPPVALLVGLKADLRSDNDTQAILMDYSPPVGQSDAFSVAAV